MLRKPAPRTEIHTVHALIDCDAVDQAEREIFESFRTRLNLGRVLTPKQRAYVDRRYAQLELGLDEIENLVSTGQAKGSAGLPPAAWELQPKPLKPPGRR